MTEYYDATGKPETRSPGASQEMREEFQQIQQDISERLPPREGYGGYLVIIKGDESGMTVISMADLLEQLGVESGGDITDAGLQSIADLETSADQMLYLTGEDTYEVTDLTAFARTFLSKDGASGALSALGLSPVSQAEAEAGTGTTARLWSAKRVKQAIEALAGGAGTGSAGSAVAQAQSLFLNESATEKAVVLQDNDALDMGTNDFTLVIEGGTDWSPDSAVTLLMKHNGVSGIIIGIQPDGQVRFTLNGTAYDSSASISTEDGRISEITITVERESAGAAGTINFYEKGSALGSSREITAGSPASVNNSSDLYLWGTSSTCTAGHVKTFLLYNRALTAAQVEDQYHHCVHDADRWADQSYAYESDFSSDTDGVTDLAGCTLTANTDSIGGENDTLKIETDGINGSGVYLGSSDLGDVLEKFAAVEVDVYIPSTNSTVAGISLQYEVGGVRSPAYWQEIATDTWTTITLTKNEITSAFDTLEIKMVDSQGSTINNTSGDLAYLKNLKIKALGCVCALEPEGLTPPPGLWVNSVPTPALNAKLPTTGASLARMARQFMYSWTFDWSASSAAQDMGGVDEALLRDDAYLEYLIGEVSGGSINELEIGDGSDADYYVEETVGLAAGTIMFALANRTHDGANKKITVTPAGSFTGSLTLTAKGFLL